MRSKSIDKSRLVSKNFSKNIETKADVSRLNIKLKKLAWSEEKQDLITADTENNTDHRITGESKSLCYRTQPRDTDCDFSIKFPPDMLEDLQYKADAMLLDINELILQILARRLDQSQGQIEQERARQTREALGIPHYITRCQTIS